MNILKIPGGVLKVGNISINKDKFAATLKLEEKDTN